MKRPFAVIGFTGFAILLMLFLCESIHGAYYAFFAFTASGALSLFNKNLRQAMTVPVILFTCAAACLLFLSHSINTSSVQKFTGENVKVEAVVAEKPYIKKSNGRYYCVLELEALDGNKAEGKLRLSFSVSKDGINEEALEVGSKLSFTGKVYVPGEGEKSISRYFAGENIVLGAYSARDIAVEAPCRKGIGYIFSQLRHSVSQKLRYGFGDKIAGLLIGMLTGDKSCLDGDIYEALKRTGIAHLMAVSGFHLSLWVFSLGMLIPESSKTSKLKYLFLASAVIFIMLLAGMSESVKRAGFMSLVYLAGKLSKRRSDSINSLGFAVSIMMLYNPACVLSLSMQLSFLSTLGILTLGQKFIRLSSELFGSKNINTPFKKLMRAAADTFFISISVLVFTLPVLIYSFGGFSTASAWVNVLVSPAAAPLMLLTGACVLLSDVSFIAFPLSLAVKAISVYIIKVAEFFSSFKNAFLVFEAENLLLYAAGAVLVAFMCILAFKKNMRSVTALILCITLSSALIITNNIIDKDSVKFHLAAYDDCIAVAVEKDKSAVLLNKTDEYEKGLFISSLEEKGIKPYAETENYGQVFLKSSVDGKYISKGEELELFDGVILKGRYNEQMLSLYKKDIHIFYSEALQCDCGCDIIIKITDNDATVSVGENSFSLKEEKEINLTLTKNKTILRGKGKWLNLMKNS